MHLRWWQSRPMEAIRGGAVAEAHCSVCGCRRPPKGYEVSLGLLTSQEARACVSHQPCITPSCVNCMIVSQRPDLKCTPSSW